MVDGSWILLFPFSCNIGLKPKEPLITVIVHAENSATAVKRAWEELQARHNDENNCHLEESVNLKNAQLKLNHYHTQQISLGPLFVVADNYQLRL